MVAIDKFLSCYDLVAVMGAGAGMSQVGTLT